MDKGIREALESGVYAGYPVVDMVVHLVDGSYHEVDSSEMAFKIAGSMAVKDAIMRAGPVLLEPVMRIEVNVTEEYTGDVIGDLSARRAQVSGMEKRGDLQAARTDFDRVANAVAVASPERAAEARRLHVALAGRLRDDALVRAANDVARLIHPEEAT